jgi:hypothetical protein
MSDSVLPLHLCRSSAICGDVRGESQGLTHVEDAFDAARSHKASPDGRGVLLGAPVHVQAELAPAGLVQLAIREATATATPPVLGKADEQSGRLTLLTCGLAVAAGDAEV